MGQGVECRLSRAGLAHSIYPSGIGEGKPPAGGADIIYNYGLQIIWYGSYMVMIHLTQTLRSGHGIISSRYVTDRNSLNIIADVIEHCVSL